MKKWKRRFGWPSRDDRNDMVEKSAFMRFFQGPDLRFSEDLWQVWRDWRHMRLQKDFGEFEKEVAILKDSAKRQVAAWENPFKNGRKGEAYAIRIKFPDTVTDYYFTNLAQLNLTCHPDELDHNSCLISGRPLEVGDFSITVYFVWDHGEKYKKLKREHRAFSYNFPIRINPDPRELWQNIPTNREIQYYKSDYESAELDCGPCQLFGASQRGRSHAHAGLPRDDDFALACFAGWKFMAVADGAGSAPFSRKGSALACEVALDVCRRQLANTPRLEEIFQNLHAESEGWQSEARKLAYAILPNAAFEAYKAIKKEANSFGREPKAYATTLLLAMSKKFPVGWITLSFQIGDGAMALIKGRGPFWEAELLADPDEGEYGGQTRFITMKELLGDGAELMRRLRISITPDLEGLLLMTDGISDAKFATLANLRNAHLWRQLWTELKALAKGGQTQQKLREWLQFWSQGNHDDRTLAFMLLKEPLAINTDSGMKTGRPNA